LPRISFHISPKADPMKKTPARAPLATIRQRIQAESARPTSVSTRIHTHAPAKSAPTMRRWPIPQPSVSPASSAKRTRPGTQVMSERSRASTEALPSTYSARENGRDRKRGSAPLTRSGETSTGATQAVSRKASAPWKISVPMKNSGRATSRSPAAAGDSCSRARAAALCET
jgi:hypothetical protein